VALPPDIKKRFPGKTEEDIKLTILGMTNGRCSLCEEIIPPEAIRTSEIDHDIPKNQGGTDELDNLRICHRECNAFKRDYPSVDVRPFLKFRRHIRKLRQPGNYSECIGFFGIDPKKILLTISGSVVTAVLPGGREVKGTLFSERIPSGRDIKYTYIELTRDSIFNDNVQPRVIKEDQLWKIYQDLQSNPLHEAPGCRVVDDINGLVQVRMFDGQHKTLANWLLERETIVAKVYFDLNELETIELVNSIQARIPKLKLSPFEFAAKLKHEFREKFKAYVSEVGAEKASELGFINWLPRKEQYQGKQALAAAFIAGILEDDRLKWKDRILLQGVSHTQGDDGPWKGIKIKENTFRSKILERLVFRKPTEYVGEEMYNARRIESENIIELLNLVYDHIFHAEDPNAPTSWERERAQRALYQSAVSFWVSQLLTVVQIKLSINKKEHALCSRRWNDEEWRSISDAVARLFGHQMWPVDFSSSEDTRKLENALQKNVDISGIAENLGLKLGYILTGS